MDGGGGFEIWQYTSRSTEKAKFEVQLGDLGFYSGIIKSRNVKETYAYYIQNNAKIIGEFSQAPNGKDTFLVEDPNGNIFKIVEGRSWFSETNHPSRCGGVAGCVIGVSDIDKSIGLYRDILGYETVEYDVTNTFSDLEALPSGKGKFRRVLLTHKQERKGPFSELLGPTEIELIQSLDRTDIQPIFQNRFWGDWGFIHLCFDIQDMDALKKECEEKGFQFTVDSGDTFDMGEAGGRFSYIEDPDGALIEFVETHKVPVLKKFGWYINLKKRDPEKRLPRWMLRAMGLNKVK
jgi:catechol 2,3-dioxygenase-like lactoylglutathione lyase family enzyme